MKLKTKHSSLQIYKPIRSQASSNPDQYRNSIDISFKLAFELNRTESYIDLAHVEKLGAVWK